MEPVKTIKPGLSITIHTAAQYSDFMRERLFLNITISLQQYHLLLKHHQHCKHSHLSLSLSLPVGITPRH